VPTKIGSSTEAASRVSIEEQVRRITAGAYGEVADAQNRRIWSEVSVDARSVLEIGCGFGKLIATDPVATRLQIGLDLDLASMARGQSAFVASRAAYVCGSAFALPFRDGAVDTVILRETVHHLRGADGRFGVLNEIGRVCARRLIVFDPNVNVRHKVARWLTRFQDDEAPYRDVLDELRRAGFEPRRLVFSDVVAFPVSGGLIGRELVPAGSAAWRLVSRVEELLSAALDTAPFLKRWLSWRYLLVAERAGRPTS
jgi:SAM-dependent methyltransferase